MSNHRPLGFADEMTKLAISSSSIKRHLETLGMWGVLAAAPTAGALGVGSLIGSRVAGEGDRRKGAVLGAALATPVIPIATIGAALGAVFSRRSQPLYRTMLYGGAAGAAGGAIGGLIGGGGARAFGAIRDRHEKTALAKSLGTLLGQKAVATKATTKSGLAKKAAEGRAKVGISLGFRGKHPQVMQAARDFRAGKLKLGKPPGGGAWTLKALRAVGAIK